MILLEVITEVRFCISSLRASGILVGGKMRSMSTIEHFSQTKKNCSVMTEVAATCTNEASCAEKVYEKGTRLFLTEVNQDLGAEKLQTELEKVFTKYGTVEEVFVPTRSTKAYAFVRLKSPEEAQQALQISTPHALFKSLESAREITPRNQKRDRLKQQALRELEEKEALASGANIICQIHRSHHERLVFFLKHHASSRDFEIVGDMPKSSSRTVSFVFVHAPNRPKFCEWIRGIWFLQSNVHRLFLVDGAAVRGGLDTEVATKLIEELSKLDKAAIRLQVFPPHLCSPLLDVLETRMDDLEKKDSVVLTPRASTHVLGLVQVVEAVPEIHDGLFCLGLWESTSVPLPTPSPSSINNVGTNICRAYWKLQEAFERYPFQLPNASNLTALDCGAAPGGWTQFVARNLQCQKIYSIDPGALDSAVLELENVAHWPLTIQNALPKLQEEENTIDVWVSDMCVKDMEQQIDWLLKALEMEVVGRGTFFVLTLKCIVGHSTQTFDRMVGEQTKRLLPLAHDLHTVHLFSNRHSERTILGYFS